MELSQLILFFLIQDFTELPRIKFLSVVNSIEQKYLLEFSEYLSDEIKNFIPFNSSKEKQLRDYLNKRYIINKFDKNPSIILDIIYI